MWSPPMSRRFDRASPDPEVWMEILVCPQAPRCPTEIWVSHEDPDSAVSEMWNHLYWAHADGRRDLTQQLLAKVKTKPVPQRRR